MIQREHYLVQIRPFYDSDLIKIITGIRRCGKSIILQQIKEEIAKTHSNIIALDFEDIGVLNALPDGESLLAYVHSHRKEGKCYVFLDEIQRVEGWADACKTLRLRNCSVFISGSNSKLLSREFTKELSGRYVSFQIRSFVYQELTEYATELKKEETIADYLLWGGFPKRLEFPTLDAQRAYLSDLNETIILNDIINRYHIRKTEIFKRVVNYVFLSNARIFSARSIANYMKSSGLSCSITTVTKYIDYLEEAFAIEIVPLYSQKVKRVLNYYQKIYDTDVSFNSIRSLGNRFDLTHNLENVVCNELLYRGYSLQVYNDGKHEIDFVAAKGQKKYYVQVAYSIADEKTYEREFSAFEALDNLNQKIIITNDDVDYSTATVKHIRVKDFLLTDEL